MRKADGFPNETLITLPLKESRHLEADPLASQLFLTDIGCFPRAEGHYRSRPTGCPQNILILCTEGRGFLELEGRRKLQVGPMDAVSIAEGLPHEYGADAEDPWTIFWLHYRGALAGSMLGPGEEFFVRRLSAQRMARAQTAFADLISLVREGSFRDSTRLVSGALWWLVALLTEAASAEPAPPWGSPEDKALDFMRARLSDPPSLREIAEVAGLSPTQLTERMRRRTGYPPLAYYTKMRMLKACALLGDGRLRVADVADALGYEDPLHFSRVFRRVIGVAPRLYRREPRA